MSISLLIISSRKIAENWVTYVKNELKMLKSIWYISSYSFMNYYVAFHRCFEDLENKGGGIYVTLVYFGIILICTLIDLYFNIFPKSLVESIIGIRQHDIAIL